MNCNRPFIIVASWRDCRKRFKELLVAVLLIFGDLASLRVTGDVEYSIFISQQICTKTLEAEVPTTDMKGFGLKIF